MPKLALIGDGQERQHGGLMHVSVALLSMYIPAGQCTVRVLAEGGDSRPSGSTARNLQTEKGGPSRPLANGVQRSVMRDRDTKEMSAGCENDTTLLVEGRNTHDALVALATVNSGRKKLTDGTLGAQSTLKLLPVNGKSDDENSWIKGATSRTETATSSKVTATSVMGGSTIFNDQMKSLAGSKPIGSLTGGKVHREALKVKFADSTAELC